MHEKNLKKSGKRVVTSRIISTDGKEHPAAEGKKIKKIITLKLGSLRVCNIQYDCDTVIK